VKITEDYAQCWCFYCFLFVDRQFYDAVYLVCYYTVGHTFEMFQVSGDFQILECVHIHTQIP
jgi:hypothetical protein